MIATIVAVAAFKNLAALTNAYGYVHTDNVCSLWFTVRFVLSNRFAVATVMFSTTVLISMQMRFVKGWSCVVALGYLLVFGFFDGISYLITELLATI